MSHMQGAQCRRKVRRQLVTKPNSVRFLCVLPLVDLFVLPLTALHKYAAGSARVPKPTLLSFCVLQSKASRASQRSTACSACSAPAISDFIDCLLASCALHAWYITISVCCAENSSQKSDVRFFSVTDEKGREDALARAFGHSRHARECSTSMQHFEG